MVYFTCVSRRPKIFLAAVPSLIARRPLALAPTAAARPLGGFNGLLTPLGGLSSGENPLTALILAAVFAAGTAAPMLDLGLVGAAGRLDGLGAAGFLPPRSGESSLPSLSRLMSASRSAA